MPAEVFDKDHVFLRKEQLLRLTELDRIIGAFVRCGVRKLRLTGGEPLLRRGAVKFLRGLGRFAELEDVARTTNGLLLAEFAEELAEAGLHRVTVSLDALDPEVFGAMNGRGHHPSRVLEGIAAAQAAGLGVKVNMVVQRGVNDSQILPMARHFKELGVTLRFIEFMDVGNTNHWEPGMVVPARKSSRCSRENSISIRFRQTIPARWPTDTATETMGPSSASSLQSPLRFAASALGRVSRPMDGFSPAFSPRRVLILSERCGQETWMTRRFTAWCPTSGADVTTGIRKSAPPVDPRRRSRCRSSAGELFAMLLAFLFFLVALVYSSVGFGGGSSYLALLHWHGVPPALLPIPALACNLIVSATGFAQFARAGHFPWRRSLPFLACSIPASYLGGLFPVREAAFLWLDRKSVV
jgi:hypothetical protein